MQRAILVVLALAFCMTASAVSARVGDVDETLFVPDGHSFRNAMSMGDIEGALPVEEIYEPGDRWHDEVMSGVNSVADGFWLVGNQTLVANRVAHEGRQARNRDAANEIQQNARYVINVVMHHYFYRRTPEAMLGEGDFTFSLFDRQVGDVVYEERVSVNTTTRWWNNPAHGMFSNAPPSRDREETAFGQFDAAADLISANVSTFVFNAAQALEPYERVTPPPRQRRNRLDEADDRD